MPRHVTDKAGASKAAQSLALWASQSSGKQRQNEEGCVMRSLKQGMIASSLHT